MKKIIAASTTVGLAIAAFAVPGATVLANGYGFF